MKLEEALACLREEGGTLMFEQSLIPLNGGPQEFSVSDLLSSDWGVVSDALDEDEEITIKVSMRDLKKLYATIPPSAYDK